MVEVLKQPQYVPMDISKQVLTIYAVSEGYLDDFDTSECGNFENEMHKYFDAHHADLLEEIAKPSGMTDELKAAISKGLDQFKEQFKATLAPATA